MAYNLHAQRRSIRSSSSDHAQECTIMYVRLCMYWHLSIYCHGEVLEYLLTLLTLLKFFENEVSCESQPKYNINLIAHETTLLSCVLADYFDTGMNKL